MMEMEGERRRVLFTDGTLYNTVGLPQWLTDWLAGPLVDTLALNLLSIQL